MRYVRLFYSLNFSAVKTEGLLYTTNPSKTALSLASHHHPCLLINALPVSQNVANRQHPCLPCQREVLSPEKIRATTGGIAFLPHPFRFSDTSANNPSIVGSASHCNRSSPLHKGAKGDTALLTLLKTALSLAPHHILASLVKGRWIDGKAQTVALLRSACDMPTLFIFQTFLPSRRRDCHTTNHSKTALSPRLAPTPLPFNERSVGFASLQSPWAFNFGHPCPPSKKG